MGVTGYREWSARRRLTTPGRQARIDRGADEIEAAWRHDVGANRIAKATMIVYLVLVLVGFYRAAKAGRRCLGQSLLIHSL